MDVGGCMKRYEAFDAEQAEVRDEIKQRGTYWAASEIWKLRRQVSALRKQLDELK
jgi:hypothetical protein